MVKMKANVFHGQNDIRVEEVEKPRAGVGEAVIRVGSVLSAVAARAALFGRGGEVETGCIERLIGRWPTRGLNVMIRIKRILCPTDLSRDADQALGYALALSRAYDATLVLCYCVKAAEVLGERSFPPTPPMRTAEVAYALSQGRSRISSKGRCLSYSGRSLLRISIGKRWSSKATMWEKR